MDRRRSLPLMRLTGLLAVPGLCFVSLQKGPAAMQIQDLPAGLRPLDRMDEVGDSPIPPP